MKTRAILWIAAAILPLSGCASYEGGTSDTTETSSSQPPGQSGSPSRAAERKAMVYPDPAGSPTFGPGANPYDIRDPNYFLHPRPPLPGPPTSTP